MFKVKMYDKALDLLSRTGNYQVGSRLHQLLNPPVATGPRAVVLRLQQAANHGLSRLEISLKEGWLNRNRNVKKPKDQGWGQKLDDGLSWMITKVFGTGNLR